MNKLTSLKMELALVDFFNPRQNMIVPNVWWGLALWHECDLLIVTKRGYATEIEIKISLSDLKRDLKKRHPHKANIIKRLFFAVPTELLRGIEYIPAYAGIIEVYDYKDGTQLCRTIRSPQVNKEARPLTEQEQIQLGKLAAMRIWSLKKARKPSGG